MAFDSIVGFRLQQRMMTLVIGRWVVEPACEPYVVHAGLS
jgi:hypothetical protein